MRTEKLTKCFVPLQNTTEGEVVYVKLVLSPPPPVIHYWPFQGGSFVVILCRLFLVLEFR